MASSGAWLTGIARMYVCICNALNDKDVTEAALAGAGTVKKVFMHHGCEAQCGTCVKEIQGMLKEFRETAKATGQAKKPQGTSCHTDLLATALG